MISIPAREFIGWRRQRMRTQSSNQVYRVTLRLLQSWLEAKRACLDDLKTQEPFDYIYDVNVDIAPWDPYELAYVLMRTYLDRRNGFRLSLDVRDACLLDKHPGIWMPSFEERIPRLAWHAIFLAIYAAFFHIIQKYRGRGTLNLRQFHVHANYLVAQFCYGNDSKCLSGGVVFPTVEGLPLHPFKSLRSGNKKSAPSIGSSSGPDHD